MKESVSFSSTLQGCYFFFEIDEEKRVLYLNVNCKLKEKVTHEEVERTHFLAFSSIFKISQGVDNCSKTFNCCQFNLFFFLLILVVYKLSS